MRQTALLPIAFAVSFGLAGCGGEDTPAEPANGTASEQTGQAEPSDQSGPASQTEQSSQTEQASQAVPVAVPDAVVDADRLAAATAAIASMEARFAAADPAGSAPRSTDPAIAADLATIFDSEYVAALPTLTITNVQPLQQWAAGATQVGIRYLLWRTGKSAPQELVGDREALALVNRNTADYPDELGPYFDFALHAHAAIARATFAHLATLDDAELQQEHNRQGLASVSSALYQTISGVVGLTVTPGLREEWLLKRLAALRAVRDTASRFLPPAAWRQLTDLASRIAASHRSPAISWELNSLST